MEKDSTSGVKKLDSHLISSINTDNCVLAERVRKTLEQITEKLENNGFDFREKYDGYSLDIDLAQDKVSVLRDDCLVMSLPYNEVNLANAVKLCYPRIDYLNFVKDRIAVDMSRRKRIKGRFSKSEDIGGNESCIKLKRLIRVGEEIDHKIKRANSLDEIPELVLCLKGFDQYESCQLLVHEKGAPVFTNFSYSKNSGPQTSLDSVANFNSIYSAVRKSKNKLFNQTQMLKNNPGGVHGTFLAKEFDLAKYGLVLMMSRNDFLQATAEEQDSFNVLSMLSSVFFKVLLKERIVRKITNLTTMLKELPYPFKIESFDGHVVLSNILYQGMGETEKADRSMTEFCLPSSFKALLFNENSDSLSTDLHHFQRILLLGELLNTLRHELSNPLFGIKLASNILQEEMESLELKELLGDIYVSSSRCQTIIENFSYLYSGKRSLAEVNIEKIIREIVILTKSETKDVKRKIVLNGFEQEKLMINTNPTWLTQIIFNLIINSAQAIKGGKARAGLKEIQVTISPDYLNKICEIIVADSGPGIEFCEKDKIFDPFYTTKTRGTGLGLAICRSLAHKLGGEIQLMNKSTLPGASFSLKLPFDGRVVDENSPY